MRIILPIAGLALTLAGTPALACDLDGFGPHRFVAFSSAWRADPPVPDRTREPADRTSRQAAPASDQSASSGVPGGNADAGNGTPSSAPSSMSARRVDDSGWTGEPQDGDVASAPAERGPGDAATFR